MAAVRPAGPDPTMTSFASIRPSPLAIVDGPPVAVDAWVGLDPIAIGADPNGVAAPAVSPERSMARPPNGFSGAAPLPCSWSVMASIVSRTAYSPGVYHRA